uniref:Uncharacterized protein n=1 Tax=Romanomermis culicivorax TaxID=13658 RepID=A0A915HWF6_ROMCU
MEQYYNCEAKPYLLLSTSKLCTLNLSSKSENSDKRSVMARFRASTGSHISGSQILRRVMESEFCVLGVQLSHMLRNNMAPKNRLNIASLTLKTQKFQRKSQLKKNLSPRNKEENKTQMACENITSCLARTSNMGSSKNLLMLTSSLKPLRRRVLIINSRAKCVAGCGSNGLMTTLLSSGSPGTI